MRCKKCKQVVTSIHDGVCYDCFCEHHEKKVWINGLGQKISGLIPIGKTLTAQYIRETMDKYQKENPGLCFLKLMELELTEEERADDYRDITK